MSLEPDYIRVNPTVDPHLFCVLLMKYDGREDEFIVGKCSRALPESAARALAESWAAATKLEIR